MGDSELDASADGEPVTLLLFDSVRDPNSNVSEVESVGDMSSSLSDLDSEAE